MIELVVLFVCLSNELEFNYGNFVFEVIEGTKTVNVKSLINEEEEHSEGLNIESTVEYSLTKEKYTVVGIKDKAFYSIGCYIKEVHFPNTLKSIGESSFESCSNLYGTITLPKSIETLGSKCFSNTSITSLIFEDGILLTEIPSYAFAYCQQLQCDIIFPDSVLTIGNECFRMSSITSITFGNQLKEIRIIS